MTIEQGYTLKQTAEALGLSEMTIRRYIKSGKLKAKLVAGKFGDEYRVEVLPGHLSKTTTTPPQEYSGLISRLEQLNQEVGYWRARAELSENRVLLLQPPKSGSWWRRIWQRH